ncbi:MAG: hypothetical protein CMB80_09350 [Flammeovirgaceae bacterium]|nr:hypothetical protein [Flammeovirgaceae bacterium]
MNPDGSDLSKEYKETLGDYLLEIIKPTEDPPAGNQFGPGYALAAEFEAAGVQFGVPDSDLRQLDFNIEIPTPGGSQGTEPQVVDKSVRSVENNEVLGSQIKAAGGYRGDGGQQALAGDKNIQTPGDAGLAQKNVSMALLYNRFSPSDDTPFIRDGETTAGLYRNQGSLGAYTRGSSTKGKEISAGDLQDLAMRMMLNATGHGGDSLDAEDALMLPGTGFSFDQTALPGTQVDMVDVNPLALANDLGLFGDDGKFQIVDSEWQLGTVKSWGQLNSPNEPFSGPFPAGMILLAALTIIGLLVIAIFIQMIWQAIASGADHGTFSPKGDGSIGNNSSDLTQHAPTPKVWKGIKGEHAPRDSGTDWSSGVGNKFMEMLGIPHTHHGWEACFPVGLESFYGFASGGLGSLMAGAGGFVPNFQELFDMLENLIMSSGYYSSIMRAVARDIQQITEGFAAFGNIGSFTGAMGAIFGVIQALTTSTTWRFIMTMAAVGDKVLDSNFNYFNPEGEVPANKKLPTPEFRVQKSRRKFGDDELVWSSNSALSLYLLPMELQRSLMLAQGHNLPGHGLRGAYVAQSMQKKLLAVSSINPTNQTRPAYMSHENQKGGIIDPAFVSRMEAHLEAEFCPFYFHDLRTNEIITFHAFITSLTESFAPSWSAKEAYGRMDDVMILQKTTRSLTLSFVVAATNETDMSGMWFKINKLVSMIYPQWSAGKLMKSGERKFRMPFSQIPTASPVVRMRIGDVVSSNYSRFGLARLFGLGDPQFESSFKKAAGAPQDTAADAEKKGEVAADAGTEATEAQTKLLSETGGVLAKGIPLVIKADIANIAITAEKGGAGSSTDMFSPTPTDTPLYLDKIPAGTKVVVEKGDIEIKHKQANPAPNATPPDSPATPNADPAAPAPGGTGEPAVDIPPGGYTYLVIVNSPEFTAEGNLPVGETGVQYQVTLVPGKHVFALGEFSAEGDADAIVAEEFPEVASAEEIGVKDFLAGGEVEATLQNPIVRSFEATRGSGLAGVITSLNFTYSDSPWESNMHNKAPIWTTVDLGFTVIHDITPGLAPDGSLRAPTHPVGDFNKLTHGRPYTEEHYNMAWNTQPPPAGSSPEEAKENDETKAGDPAATEVKPSPTSVMA